MDIRIKHNPLRDWKREVVLVADGRAYFKLSRRYRLSFRGEIVADNLKTLKEVKEFLKKNAK
jgi:hypothetical protein